MILDRLDNADCYPLGAAWQTAIDFLKGLKPDAADQKYVLDGDDLFVLVMGYETRVPEPPLFEAHRKYVDIQALVTGEEAIEWAHINGLQVETPFDADKDAILYHRPPSGITRMELRPGVFAAFWPQDGHMPGLVLGDAPQTVNKAVVKINVELLRKA